MIQKLRRKFVGVCMLLVTAVLAVVFCSIYVSVQKNIESLSEQILVQVIREDRKPGNHPDVGITIGGDRILLPYFTVTIFGSTAYVTGGTYADLEDTDALRSILAECLEQPTDRGIIESYHLRYLRQENGFLQKLAFVDMSMEQAMLRQMAASYLRIVLAALVLLLFVSILLSRWVTRPVEKAWQQQRQFLSDASHELKTPLTVILSNAELLDSAPMEDRPARWADNILAEARRMRTLVEEMLTLARADQMASPPIHSEICLSDLAADCALAFEPVAFEAGRSLIYEITDGITVLGDRDKLHRVLSVLLDNAIKYSSVGSAVTLSLECTEKSARLTVANTGNPIPPEQLPHLFERFYRADSSRGEQSGFGLGLSIASAIAQEHKGTLKAESDSASTRFIYTMPLKK